ncbi:MAG: DEAD/DEAH box helicase [Promethearchaeota archaeon]
MDFPKILHELNKKHTDVIVDFPLDYTLPISLKSNFKLREYQNRAINAWHQADKQGLIILPTGAGKSFIGLSSIISLQQRTLIIVPTIELMEQWYQRILSNLIWDTSKISSEQLIGRFGGSYKNIAPITITTYHSGYIYLKKFQNYFGLLIFDEVHHLAAEKFQKIAKGIIAPARMGLTATLKESDKIYAILSSIIGSIVYQGSKKELTKSGDLSDYEHKKIRVKLQPTKYQRYLEEKEIYSTYLKTLGFKGNAFQQMIFRSNRDLAAKNALKAYNRARNMSFNSEGKINEIRNLFSKHPKDRILLFCENIAFIERISQYFFIPALTSRTSISERKKIMQNFRDGKFRILASGKVLDEGVDVPQANVGIIVSGTGTKRQFIQRLGRLLRPLPGKKAFLYELITSKTSETRLALKRSKEIN